ERRLRGHPRAVQPIHWAADSGGAGALPGKLVHRQQLAGLLRVASGFAGSVGEQAGRATSSPVLAGGVRDRGPSCDGDRDRMESGWRIELLGWLRATRGDQVVSRFRTHKTASLLAYLAFYQQRSHPREVLIELFWPETSPRAGSQSQRKALP